MSSLSTTAIAKREAKPQSDALVKSAVDTGTNAIAKLNMRELRELAEVFVKSGAWSDVKDVAQAMVKVIAGQELGFSPIVSMAGIHFFQGKVVIGSTLMASLIKESSKYDYDVLEHTSEKCSVQFKEFNAASGWKKLGVPVTYTRKDATDAGLLSKDTWKKYPADMLFAAVMRQGCRRYCADVLRGVTADHDTESDTDFSPENEAAIAKQLEEAEPAAPPAAEEATAVEEAAPAAEAEAVDEDAEEAAAIAEEGSTTGTDESNLINLRQSFLDIYNPAKGEQKKRMNDWLGDRRIGELTAEDFKEGLDTFGG